jgi:exonuclease SbcC
MRIRSIKAHAMGAFSDVSIYLDALPESAKLVAIVGENGAGKSTLCDLATYGALWREWPRKARGHLGHVARARDSMLEVGIDVGSKSYTLRHLVDGVSGKGEAIALDGDGVALTKSGKLTEYGTWVDANLPPKSVLTSSIISHPAYGSFVAMKASARKDVILLALGVEGVEAKAKEARDRARAEGAKADALRGRVRDEAARADTDSAEEVLASARHNEHTLGFEVEETRTTLAVSKELAGNSVLARQRYEEQLEAFHAVLARRDSIYCQLETSRERLEKCDVAFCESKLTQANTDCREAAERAAANEAIASNLRTRRETAERHREARGRVVGELSRADLAKNALEQRIDNNRKVLANADAIRAVIAARESAIVELPTLQERERVAQAEVERADDALEMLSSERHEGADARIRCLRGGLQRIAQIVGTPTAVARITLETDDATVKAAESLPQRKTEAERERREVAAVRANATVAVRNCGARAMATHPQEPILATAEARIAELTPSFEEAKAAVERLNAELREIPVPEPVPADPDLAGLRRASEQAAARAREASEALARVEATRAQLEPQVERLRAELAALEEQLSATPEPTPPEQGPDLTRIEQELAEAQRQHSAAVAAVGAAEANLASAKAANAKVAELRNQLAAVELEQSDWARLGADLGRDGLQAALVDSAGPELTELSNDLLHATFGSRWTVSIETQRAKVSGGTSEECDVRIIDTESGLDGLVEDLSDGERTIVGEAVSLALAILACRRAHFDRPTLIRDESGAALSRERRPQWVAMLRRAADIVGADRVLIVSHSEDVQELCDARIEVGGGTARIA